MSKRTVIETADGEVIRPISEEIANALTHGLGALLLLLAFPFLLTKAWEQGGTLAVLSASVFAVTAVLLYIASTFYHAMTPGRAKRFFQAADHSAIFLLIAGTYTPIMLCALRGPWGWSLFGTVWALAAIGLFAECVGFRKIRTISTFLYLAMGWLVVIAAVPMVTHIAVNGLVLIVAGGLAYTTGLIFYAIDFRYFHTIWHCFVMFGTGFHFFAIMNYAV